MSATILKKVKTAILISGRGSNMTALIEASTADDFPAKIELVISNRLDAKGLLTARAMGVPAIAIDHKAYTGREAFEAALQEKLLAFEIEFVCCAGFMRVLTPGFVDQWPRRMINIHPSLLPKYKGLNTHARALEAGDAQHGCTVHWVSSELDSGEIILQETVDITRDDTQDSLAQKVLEKELILYPKALIRAVSDRDWAKP